MGGGGEREGMVDGGGGLRVGKKNVPESRKCVHTLSNKYVTNLKE
jgi:hypothetical protein